jgi:hypothetical protein
VDRRSALCIQDEYHLIWLATEGYFNGLSYHEMGLWMSQSPKQGGLGCREGLNLDGGGSTQWAVRHQDGRMERIGGMEATPLYLLAVPRSHKE